jgi:hypothetical protein
VDAEQLAHKAWDAIASHFDILELQNLVERAVYDAVTAQREFDARIAEAFIPSGFSGNIGIARDDRARTIAYCIRSGKIPDEKH